MKRHHVPITVHEVWKGRGTGGKLCIAEFRFTKLGENRAQVICGPNGGKLRPLSVSEDFQPAIFRTFPGMVVVEVDAKRGTLEISQLTGQVGSLWFDSGLHAQAKILFKSELGPEWEQGVPCRYRAAACAAVAAAKGNAEGPAWAAEELYEIK